MSFIHPDFVDGKTFLITEAKGLAQGLTASKWQNQDISPSVSSPGVFLLRESCLPHHGHFYAQNGMMKL